jgi:hypothetical protein
VSGSEAGRQGDPAFTGDDRITHEPVVEEERASPLPDAEGLRRPFPFAVVAVAVAFAVAALVSGLAAGAAYAIPFAVVAAIVIGFVVTNRQLSRNRSDDSDDPIPNVNFDAETPLGATGEQSDAERQAHADPEPSTGQR